MSGQPVKTQSDINKFRNEYLETLNLQESINDMNLQANKNYLLSGQLPPQSQMQDTRTNAEKLADVEKLKRDIADNLSPIAEPSFAYDIVSRVMSSPLNLDNSLLRFLAQRATSIAEQLKKILPYGIAGDVNDLDRIVEFIKNMYAEQQGKFQTTKSYMNSISSQGSSSRVLSANDIDSIILGLQDIMKNIELIKQRIGRLDALTNLFNILRRLKNALPTTEDMKIILNELDDPRFNDPLNKDLFDKNDFEALFSLMEKLPKYNEVIALINKINQYIKSGNIRLIIDGINNLNKMFVSVENISNINLMNRFVEMKNNVKRRIKEQEGKEQEGKEQEDNRLKNAMNVVGLAGLTGLSQTNPTEQYDDMEEDFSDFNYIGKKYKSDMLDKNFTLKNVIRRNDQLIYLLESDDGEEIQLSPKEMERMLTPITTKNNNREFDEQKQFFNNRQLYGTQPFDNNQFYSYLPVSSYNDALGFGLKKKRRGRPRGSGIAKVIPPKIPNFVGFGINEINQKQLKNGIVKIRRNTKTNYIDLPSKRVSANLQKILNTIVGGGVPKYEELGKLDNEEKEYLHKLVSRSSLEDRLSVPAPSKDQQEKDIHNFEVMRGQILSGNDSIELVKKFKLLIRKLSKQGLLPDRDVDDLIEVLTDLGY